MSTLSLDYTNLELFVNRKLYYDEVDIYLTDFFHIDTTMYFFHIKENFQYTKIFSLSKTTANPKSIYGTPQIFQCTIFGGSDLIFSKYIMVISSLAPSPDNSKSNIWTFYTFISEINRIMIEEVCL